MINKFSFYFLVLGIFILACSRINPNSVGNGGDESSNDLSGSNGTKAFIRINGTPVAQLLMWTDEPREVLVFLPEFDRYSFINLDTGLYSSETFDGTTEFFYPTPDCSGDPIATGKYHLGEKNKSVLFHPPTNSYFLVTGDKTSFSFGSSWRGSCSGDPGTTQEGYELSPTSQPFEFSSHAPLEITYSVSNDNLGAPFSADNKGVIKSNGIIVAKIISWTDEARRVVVYVPSTEKYAVIHLATGLYSSNAIDGNTQFYYPTSDCSGPPSAVNDKHTGEKNKTVVYHDRTDSYFLVTSEKTTFNFSSFGSRWNGVDSCTTAAATSQNAFLVTPTVQPYNFEAIAPLTITYE